MIASTLFLLSVGIQLLAAAYALLLIRITGWKMAWIFMSIAMVLMVSRRVVTFISFVAEGKPISFDVPEIIALSISCLMLLGVLNIRALFHSIYAAEAERRIAEQKIAKLNAELLLKIRQLVAAQAELINKEKLALLGRVATGVGNELRNPLGVMSNAVYFLQTKLEGTEEIIQEYLGIIRDEITRSERIAVALMDAVQTPSPALATHAVAQLLGQILREHRIPPGITVSTDIPETLPAIMVDSIQTKHIFDHLISNAVDAMPAGGELEIRAREAAQAGAIVISVRDSGIGMSAEDMARLFQPLFTTKARGIGLGLLVAKNLAEANGGSIEVQSAIGKGSVFSINLPTINEREKNERGNLV